MNDLAWYLATAPDSKLRNPARALELAKKAAEALPKDATYWGKSGYWGTYGVARYRTGDWKGAVETLEKAFGLRKPGDFFSVGAAQGFFVAMAHWQLGDKVKARQWFDNSVQSMEKELSEKKKWLPEDAELKRLRAEAAELIRVEQKP
jgi:hypothetical protein